uniref:Uncharacterized protein n=1 Tax=Arundo donax TaxID=35708 RepID=A0A0A9H8T4_ARUDO
MHQACFDDYLYLMTVYMYPLYVSLQIFIVSLLFYWGSEKHLHCLFRIVWKLMELLKLWKIDLGFDRILF